MDLPDLWERVYLHSKASSRPWRSHLYLLQATKEDEGSKREKQEDQGGKQGAREKTEGRT